MFEKGVYCSEGGGGGDNGSSSSEGGVSASCPNLVGNPWGGAGGRAAGEVPLAKNGFWSEEFAEPPPPGERSRKFAADVKKDLELIEQATDT